MNSKLTAEGDDADDDEVLVGGRKLLDLLNQGSSNGLD